MTPCFLRTDLASAGVCQSILGYTSNTLCLKKKHVTTFFAITGTMNVRL